MPSSPHAAPVHTRPHIAEDHDHGLARDLQRLASTAPDRRGVLRWLSLAGIAPAATFGLVGCGGGGDAAGTTATSGSSTSGSTTTTTTTTTSGTCSVIPEETAGPYPGDGSNSTSRGVANALLLSGIVRSDIRSSVAGATGTAEGVLLTITLKLANTNASCASLAGHAIYLWHCTADGEYSMYASELASENFLRGVQETDANGEVTFTTIFPGCYLGRMPHMHFEVYPSLQLATSASNKLCTSQLTFPLATLNEVYTATGYSASVANLARISYASDNVFSDGTALQMATVSGSNAEGYTAQLDVAIAA